GSGTASRTPEPAPEELPTLDLSAVEAPVLEASALELEPDTVREPPEGFGLAQPSPVSLVEEGWTQVPAAAPQPLILGPASRDGGDDDLWRIVSEPRGGRPQSLSSSFDAVFERVDANLEALVSLDVLASPELPIEAIVEAEVELAEAAPAKGDNSEQSGDTPDLNDPGELDSWGFDEDDVAGDPNNPEDAARMRRQRLLRRAMENMGTYGQRPPEPAAPPQPVSAAPVTPPPAAAAAPAPASADESRLAAQIEQRFAALKGPRDHFAVLGLAPQATRDQVKAAFLSLAKVFHPDRLPPALAQLAPKMSSVFESIREAYEVLYDDAKRQAYLQSAKHAQAVAAAKPPPNPAEAALELFKKAEVLLRRREFSAAEELYGRAHQADPKPLYLASRAWALYMDPQLKAESARAKQMMADAVRADPTCDRAHYQLGVIARVEGDMDRAERHFREAVRANPKHLEASQELRLIEMRKRNPPKKGLFR
ncbi:MAG TPA: J domain-containing protein, partial [Aggregicoccus sp.]|nr:J domain-containing protein [Aggregicoccus sp.]